MTSPRSRTLAFAIALVVPMLVLYVWLAPAFIVDGDNAEFSTLSVEGGMAHPPGYPAYVMYLRAMSWLPGAPAHAAAIATALLGVAAALVLWCACRAWGTRPLAASIAVAVFAAGPIVMRLHTAAEVFAMNHLVVALVLWLCATNGPLRGMARTFVLGVVGGLGMANQHTCVLVGPLGILGGWRGARESKRTVATIAVGLAGLALGLSAYGYAFLSHGSMASWGEPSTPSLLLAHFTRVDYGGAGAFSPVEGSTDPIANLSAFAMSLGRGWLWILAPVGLVMFGVRCVRKGAGESVWAWRWLCLSFLLAGPILVARFNVPPVGIGLNICQRFHLLSILLLAIPIALGLDALFARVPAIKSALFAKTGVQAVLVGAFFIATAAISLGYVRATHSPAVEQGVLNFLRSMPENAVVLTTADDMYFGSTYAQRALGVRPDVVVVAWPMTVLPWYRERLANRGVHIDPYAGKGTTTDQPSLVVGKQVFATGQPLFCEISLGNVLEAFPSYPFGLVFRVLPPGTPRPDLDSIVMMNHDAFEKFQLDYTFPDEEQEYAAEMHVRYARTWEILARALRDSGQRDQAQEAIALAHRLAPQR